jgi:thiamine-phosphate pyrophosphorylase
MTRRDAPAFHGLHALADDDPRWPRDPVEQARAACEGGAHVVQLRTKHATDRQTLEFAHAIRALTRNAGARFVVNDRFDLAIAAEADAVHLGQDDLPPGRIPATLRARLAIGRSTHTLAQAEASNAEDIDYVAFGPVFSTTSKASDYTERGLALLSRIVATVAPRPVVAIGGLNAENVPEVLAAGARGIAVISALSAAADPVAAARSLWSRD